MTRILLCLAALLLCPFAHAQSDFPKTAREDKGGLMSAAYWNQWNPEIQARIDANIEKHRKADAEIFIKDLAPNSVVTIEQLSHDFIFGAHIFNFNQLGKKEYNQTHQALYGTLFNSATVAFYWDMFEMQPNRPRFKGEYWDTQEYWNAVAEPKKERHWRRPATDPVVEFCERKGVRIHGHPFVWGSRKWNHPSWLTQAFMTPEEKAKMDEMITDYAISADYLDEVYSEKYQNTPVAELEAMFPEFAKTLRRAFEKRIVEIARHYGDRVHSWDIVNESAVDYQRGFLIPGSALAKSLYGIMPGDYTYEAFKVATRELPKNVLMNINDFNLSENYVKQIKDLIARGCRVDIIGAQMHLMRPQQILDIAAGKDIQTPDRVDAGKENQTPEAIWAWAERLGGVGLPIHLSEVTVTAPGTSPKDWQMQATITRNLYRLWFSLEPLMGITWWNVVDDCGAPGEPSHSGLFTRRMDKKPVFYALDNLINSEWKTRLTAQPGKDGRIHFRGFKGKYRVTWTNQAGTTLSQEFYLKNDGDGL